MDLNKHFGNPDLKASAQWLTLTGDNAKDTAKFLIAPLNNPRHRALAIASQAVVLSEEKDLGKLMQLDVEASAKALVLDWDGVTIGESDLEYSEQNAIELFSNYPDLHEMVKEKAEALEAARKDKVAKIKKK